MYYFKIFLLTVAMIFFMNSSDYIAVAQQVNITTLPNGLRVLVKEDNRFPLVSVRLYVHAGSAYENKENYGISHLIEHMVFKGTKDFPKGEVATIIEESGGYLNAATSFDYTVYLTDMSKDSWKKSLPILRDMTFYPNLDLSELESEKQVVLAELYQGNDSPSNKLFQLTQKYALNNTPYQEPIIGFEDIIKKITPEDMTKYMHEHYYPESMLLVISGDVKHGDAINAAKKYFGNIKRKGTYKSPTPVDLSLIDNNFKVVSEASDWNKVYLSFSFAVPGIENLDAVQLDILAHILGGDETSRFYKAFHLEKRLVDSISVSNYSFERVGLFTVQAVLDASKLEEFWKEFASHIKGLNKIEITEQEIARAKLLIADGLFRSKETIAGDASKLGFFNFFFANQDAEEKYLNDINLTTKDNLLNLLDKYVNVNKGTLIVLHPKELKIPSKFKNLNSWLEDIYNKSKPIAFSKPLDSNYPTVSFNQIKENDELNNKKIVTESKIIDLENNRTLILQQDNTLPYVSVTLTFNGGDLLIKPTEQGLPAFAASLLTKGTKDMNLYEYNELLAGIATNISVSSGSESFTVSIDGPSLFMDSIFDVLEKTVNQPAFSDKEAKLVKANQLAAITIREDQPFGLATRKLFPFIFGDQIYGFNKLGNKDFVETLSPKMAKSFWSQQTKQPWVLSLCGNFTDDDVKKILANVEKLPVPTKDKIEVSKPIWGDDKELNLNLPNRQQAHLFIVFPTDGIVSEDAPALSVLQKVLSGQSGLIFKDLRDVQGLGYTVTAFSWSTKNTGALIFYAGTSVDKVEHTKNEFFNIVNKLHVNILPEKEIERGKNQLVGEFFRGYQTLESRSTSASTLNNINLPIDFELKEIEKSKNVTAIDLQKIAKKYLFTDKAYVITVLP